MPRKKHRLTLKEHIALGDCLKQYRYDLLQIFSDLHGILSAKELRDLRQALDEVFSIREELENQLFADFPKQASCKVYFGQTTLERIEP